VTLKPLGRKTAATKNDGKNGGAFLEERVSHATHDAIFHFPSEMYAMCVRSPRRMDEPIHETTKSRNKDTKTPVHAMTRRWINTHQSHQSHESVDSAASQTTPLSLHNNVHQEQHELC